MLTELATKQQEFEPETLKIRVGKMEIDSSITPRLFTTVMIDGKPCEMRIKSIKINISAGSFPSVVLEILPT